MRYSEAIKLVRLLLKTPHLQKSLTRALYVKHYKGAREHRRKDGYSSLSPHQVGIQITNMCNLRCKPCGQWGENGHCFKMDRAMLREVLPVARYLELADELSASNPIYYIWGGEPFLYRDLMEFTARIKYHGSVLSLVTNGTLLEPHAEEIVQQEWDILMISIDGPPNVHDKIRGQQGSFQKLAKGIEALQKNKQKLNRALPLITAMMTISSGNADALVETLEKCEALNIDSVVINLSWFTNEDIGNAHSKLMQEKLGTVASKWRGFAFDHGVDTEVLLESMQKIRERKWSFPYFFLPDLEKEQQINEYYQDPGSFLGYGPCVYPWHNTEILANGDVATCRDYSDYIVGNLKTSSMSEIWNNERYRAFRQALQEEGGTFPICARCCGLMGW